MTKKIFSFSEVKEKIQEEMDLQEESFISNTEYLDYVNEAIDECEAEIHGIYQDYFLAKANVSLVSGTAEYSLPSDIYANKIRHIQFKLNNSNIYEVRRIPIEDVMFIDESVSNQDFMYHLENSLSGGQKIVFHPTPQTTDSTSMTIWYIRNAARVTADADTIDIPEFIQFIFAFLGVKIARKEINPLTQTYEAELENQRVLMRETLDRMVPDGNDNLFPNTSFYNDFDPERHFGGFHGSF